MRDFLGYHITAMHLSLLNNVDQSSFVSRLGAVFEHSPWVAERAWEKRPFKSLVELHEAMMAAVHAASDEEKLDLIRAHPELAGREAIAGSLTADSSGEQGRLGFTSLSRNEFLRIQDINRQYREKFGFPCIVALVLHATRQSVVDEMAKRLGGDRAGEIDCALSQIGAITLGRLKKMADKG